VAAVIVGCQYFLVLENVQVFRVTEVLWEFTELGFYTLRLLVWCGDDMIKMPFES
jgi:hypothetical protein